MTPLHVDEPDWRICLKLAQYVKRNVVALAAASPPPSALDRASLYLFAVFSFLLAAPFLYVFAVSLLSGVYALALVMFIPSAAFVALGIDMSVKLLKEPGSPLERKRKELEACVKRYCKAARDPHVCWEVEAALHVLNVHRNLAAVAPAAESTAVELPPEDPSQRLPYRRHYPGSR